jgi:hypothetical protein
MTLPQNAHLITGRFWEMFIPIVVAVEIWDRIPGIVNNSEGEPAGLVVFRALDA